MSFLGCTTERFLKKIDYSVNAINPIAGHVPQSAKIPLPPGNDRQAVEVVPQNSESSGGSASRPPGKGKRLRGTV